MKNYCPFCDLKSLKNQIITENKEFIVIYARRPLAKAHLIIIPKRHKINFFSLQPSEAKGFFKLLDKLTKVLLKTYKSSGFNLFANVGKNSGQSISHLHFHLILRFSKEKISPFKILNNTRLYKLRKQLNPSQLKSNIKKIKANM